MFDAHQKRLAELDEEIQRSDVEIEALLERSLANPKGTAEMLEHARSRRAVFDRERADLIAGIEVLAKRERSANRIAQRERGRESLKTALGFPEQRLKLAKEMDQAAEAFLAAMDKLTLHGAAAISAVHNAAMAATPRVMTDPQHEQQRRLMIEATVPHAGGFTGPAMQYALVIFLARILDRVQNSRGIAQIAGGWQFDNTTVMPFAQAAQMAAESMAHGAERIVSGLAEPK